MSIGSSPTNPKAIQDDDVTGHGFKRPPMEGSEDTGLGHLAGQQEQEPAGSDDVEGHGRVRGVTDEGDDVESHAIRVKGPPTRPPAS